MGIPERKNEEGLLGLADRALMPKDREIIGQGEGKEWTNFSVQSMPVRRTIPTQVVRVRSKVVWQGERVVENNMGYNPLEHNCHFQNMKL